MAAETYFPWVGIIEHDGVLFIFKGVISVYHRSFDRKNKNCMDIYSSYVTLSDCGKLLACGSNAFGQLGVGQTVTHSADLLVVEVRSSR